MERVFWVFILIVFLLGTLGVLFITDGSASDQKLPVIDGKEVVATVNGEPITLVEFNRALATMHTEMHEGDEAGKINYSKIMDRLINLRLILQEARNIGIDELPETQNAVDIYSQNILRGLLVKGHVKDIKADEEEIDKLYKEAVKEWKIKSLMFNKEEDAKKAAEEISAGNDFGKTAESLIADGKAKGSAVGEYLKDRDLLPQVAEAVSKMEIGSVSSVLQVEESFIILKLEDIRFPENPEEKELARQEILNRKRSEAVRDYSDSLVEKYVKIDKKLLDSIDYNLSVEEFQKLLKDSRVIAEIKGEDPLTVGTLTEAIQKKYFHGVETALERGKLNDRKEQMLKEILYKKVLIKEALELAIDRTEAYTVTIKEYKDSIIFDKFIKNIIIPSVKMDKKEVELYFNKNVKEYMLPEMVRIKSLVFARRDNAEDALTALRKGADFKWLSSSAKGQLDKDSEGILRFGEDILTKASLPEEVQKAVAGAGPGDGRLYADPKGHFYVFYIQDVFPSKPQSFDAVKEKITETIYRDKINKAVEAYADKLKKFYKVKIYAKDLKK